MTCGQEGTGNLLSADGSPISFDGLQEHKYKVLFSKIPNTIFFLQSFSFPDVSVGQVVQQTQYLDIDGPGEKIVFKPFTMTFLLDAQMNNYFELFSWMKRMTVQGENIDEMGDCFLIVNDALKIKFVDCWPSDLGGIRFISNTNEPNYVVCDVTMHYDWFEVSR